MLRARYSAPAGRGKQSLGGGTAGAGSRSSGQKGTSGCWVQSPAAGRKHLLGVYQVRLRTASGRWVSVWLCSPSSSAGNRSPAFVSWRVAAEVRRKQERCLDPMLCFNTWEQRLHRIQPKLHVWREARCKSTQGLPPRQRSTKTSEWVACTARVGRVFHVQLVTDALLSTLGSKTFYNKERYRTQRCDACSRVLVLYMQVSRDTLLWGQFCCADWSKSPIICVSKVGIAVLWDPWMKIIIQYQILCSPISPSDFYSSQCSI